MSNSNLVSYTKISPNKTSPRNHAIDRITIHCVVGQCTVETLGNIFAPLPNRLLPTMALARMAGLECMWKKRIVLGAVLPAPTITEP